MHNAQSAHNYRYENELMAKFLRIALWNAKGLEQHAEEVKSFLLKEKIIFFSFQEPTSQKKLHKNNPPQDPDGTAIIIKSAMTS